MTTAKLRMATEVKSNCSLGALPYCCDDICVCPPTWTMQILAEFRAWNSDLDDRSIALFCDGGRFFSEIRVQQHAPLVWACWTFCIRSANDLPTCIANRKTQKMLSSHRCMRAYEANVLMAFTCGDLQSYFQPWKLQQNHGRLFRNLGIYVLEKEVNVINKTSKKKPAGVCFWKIITVLLNNKCGQQLLSLII